MSIRGQTLISQSWVRAALIAGLLLAAAYLGLQPSLRWLILLALAAGAIVIAQKPQIGPILVLLAAIALPIDLNTGTDVALTVPVLLLPFLMLLAGIRYAAGQMQLTALKSPVILRLVLFGFAAVLSFAVGYVLWPPAVVKAPLVVQLGQLMIYLLAVGTVFLSAQDFEDIRLLKLAVYLFIAVGGCQILREFGLPVPVPIARDAHGSVFWVWVAAMAGGQLLFHTSLNAWGKLGLSSVLLLTLVWLLSNNGWLSGWLPVVVTLLVLLFLRFGDRRRWYYVVAVLLIVALMSTTIYEFAGGDAEMQLSGYSRLELYKAVLQDVWKRPILGLGMTAYRYYHYQQPLRYKNTLWFDPRISSHNDYIDVFAQTGLLGLGTLLWALGTLGKRGWRLTQSPEIRGDGFAQGYVNGALAGMAGTAISGLLGNWVLPFIYNGGFTGFRASLVGWIFMGGLVALDMRSSRIHEEVEGGDST